MFKRFLAVLRARNLEFFRDRASLGWNIIFPVMLLFGFAFVFSDSDKPEYKVGVLNTTAQTSAFMDAKYFEFVDYDDNESASLKLRQHQIDLLIDLASNEYWVNQAANKSFLAERIMLSYVADEQWQKQTVDGKAIRYLDWVLPGILGMNMMFSCLFGVGYVIVRYRKNSVLKRLQVTPLSATEFILAQVTSRMLIVLSLAAFIFIGCNFIFDFYMLGSYLNLLLIAALGALSLVALGLLVASRSRSEELIGGLLNFTSWPMMMLSGVWFSLEGAPDVVKTIADFLPLTHLVSGARKIMLEGATLSDISYHVFMLIGMITVFVIISALTFRWQGDGR